MTSLFSARGPVRKLLLFLASSCSKENEQAKKPKSPARRTEIRRSSRGPGLDLVFIIKQQTLAPDGSRTLEVTARTTAWRSPARRARCEVGVGRAGSKQKFAFHTGTVEYRTVGAPSNTLLEVLDDLYRPT